jgi:type IX secretion system PorP/SprF family membrane protein
VAGAQDIHFSQFWASPLNLSPTQAGFLDCTYRAAANYRTQWGSVNAGNGPIYKTYSISYDHLFDSPFLAGDKVGLGLVLYNDVAGDARLSNLSILINAAYHKQLGSMSMLSLGLQGGFTQKSLQKEFLKFPNMFNSATGTFTLPPTDPLYAAPNIGNIDFTLALQYAQELDNGMSFNVGAAGLHLLTPTESFSTTGDNELPMRIVGHGGLSMPLGQAQRMSLNPKVLYMGQAAAKEISIGTDVGYKLQNPSFDAVLYGGLWWRMKDAVIPYLAIDYRQFKFGMSYDVNVSSLSEVSHGKGALELSLIYQGCLASSPNVIVAPCIRI